MISLAMAPAPGATVTPASQQSVAFMFGWFLLWSIGIAGICYAIAKQKGRCAVLAAILGLIPGVNFFVLLYIALSTNMTVEKKLDAILSKLTSPEKNQPVQ